MPLIHATRPNAYTGSLLDRAARLRDDAPRIEAWRTAPNTLWVPQIGGRHLLLGQALPTGGEARDLGLDFETWAFLGLLGQTPVFAGAVVGEPTLEPEVTTLLDLRAAAGLLPPDRAGLLAHARGLLHWRARHRFCANCGSPTEPRAAGNTTLCPACGTQHFPRTDPAVIMLVVRGDAALLGHSARFPTATMFSTLAGFVEPGESLEQAVAREVEEEVGVRVRDVTYHSSQPWPFPASLMVGFHCETDDTAFRIDADELTEARWFSRAELAEPQGFDLPGTYSIARRLIEDWLAA